jgi:hypothetical protein
MDRPESGVFPPIWVEARNHVVENVIAYARRHRALNWGIGWAML